MFRECLARTVALALAILLAWSAWWSLRIGYAGFIAQNLGLAATRAALRLTPADPHLHLQLARALLASKSSDAGLKRDAVEDSLNDALFRNPANSTLWIESADAAEQLQDYTTAEVDLLRAVQLDRTFSPRWLLAEYYARRSNTTKFWPAMRAALAASYDDVTPLFETCWGLTTTPEEILRKAIPTKTEILTQYLEFLLSKQRLDLAQPVAAQLLVRPVSKSVPVLLAYCDRLLWYNQPDAAREVWNKLYPPANGITNPTFEKPFLQQAFDWRLASAPGITSEQEKGLIRLELTGKQLEHAELASQFILLAPLASYRLTVAYFTETDVSALIPGIVRTPDTGIHFRLLNMATHADLLEFAPPLQGPERQPQTQTYPFTTPPNSTLYRLILAYDRTYGSTRFEGAVTLTGLTLTQ